MSGAGGDAAGILRGRRDRYHYTGFALGFVPAAVLTPFQIFVGDTAARAIASDQPVKFAAMELKWELGRVTEGPMDVLRDVREISRGIHPAILSERGLEPAVKALARRSPVPVDLTVRVAGRLRDRVELGAYYIVSEALANVAKHANAEMVMVSIEAGRDSGCTGKISSHEPVRA